MDNTKQVETVEKALDLEVLAAEINEELAGIKREQFRAEPKPPVCEKIGKTYPPVVPRTQFNWMIALIPSLFFLPWCLIYYFCIYKKQREMEVIEIRNSNEYKAACAAVDAEADRKQAEANARYEAEKAKYENETLPEYKRELEKWQSDRAERADAAEKKLRRALDELSSLYVETKIIPLQYRKIDALSYIFDLMSTSEYDIKQAIDLYDRQQQRRLDEANLIAQRQANRLASEQNYLLDAQNELIDEQNDISRKARRDANIAAAIGTVQRHNTNKALKNLTGRKK